MDNNMQNIDNPVIGIDLLKMLMLQLYSNPRCIYREYIQNALDSINEAVHAGILAEEKDGRVSISITKNDIYIEDNGTGIRSDRAVKILTDIANSVKNGMLHMATTILTLVTGLKIIIYQNTLMVIYLY